MTSDKIANELLALPLAERVELAQVLWQSVHDALDLDAAAAERLAVAESQRRDAELDSGAVQALTHEQVMEALRNVVRCE